VASADFQQRKLGPFLIGRRLGAGGMATVFAAREETQHVKRLVALKILSTNLAGDDAEHRAFLREAEIATRLEHPNIVRIFDVGDVQGTMYLAMELVHGTSVSALLKAAKGRPVPLPIALRIVSDVAGALHHAHELADANTGPLGVVHQDVSPQNVLVSYEGTVKLVDFGVARLGSLEGSRTETLRGKPSYASPEQIAGKNIDRRTDVFALGIITWELLTGERLFRRDTSAATYLAVIQAPIPYVREKNEEVPAAIADQIARALERDREIRFKTAEAYRMALANAAKEVGVAEATRQELAKWVNELAPPAFAKEELDREIITDPAPLPQSGLHAAAAIAATMASAPPKLIEASEVPDLDLPGPDLLASTPTKPVPKPTSTSAAPPEVHMPPPSAPGVAAAPSRPPSSPELGAPQVRQSSPQLRQSSPQVRQSSPSYGAQDAISLDHFGGDGFDDMEIERDGASSMPAQAMQARSSSAMRAAAPAAPMRQRVANTGLELAGQRSGLDRHYDDYEASTATKIVAAIVPVVVFGGAIAGLVKVAHKAHGIDVLRAMPHAFDGSSAAESGGVALVSLVLAFALGAFGFKFHPRSWALVASGGAMLLWALAMVTVTLASTGENPMPPDGVLLFPYLVPLSLVALALGILGRGRQMMLSDSIGRKVAGVPVAAVAAAVAFAAFETSKLVSLLH
jgi:serine/threonine protein kinase